MVSLNKAKLFYVTPSCSIIFFHDGTDVIPELASERILDDAICYFSFSWFVSRKTIEHISMVLSDATEYVGVDRIKARVRLLFNSKDEFNRARTVIPEEMCVPFNNASFLNEAAFDVGGQPTYAAVYNARANCFKRHHLSVKVENKIFIAYDWKYQDYDLQTFGPKEIYMNLKGDEVQTVIRKAKVGLMLSEEEGACYASLEYLLCGLPVVSTVSRGGRDEFYQESNSIICDDDADSVAASVERALKSLSEGSFRSDHIRQSAKDRINHFRRILDDDLQRSFFQITGDRLPDNMLNDRIKETNKLWKYRNMRIKSLSELR